MNLKLNSDKFLNNLTQTENRLLRATRLYAETSAAQLEAYAKQNAPWKDITGISRQTISHDVKSERYKQTIILRGGVSAHFPYLELGFERRYAIIEPTMIKLAPNIVRGWIRIIKQP
jgi:hypothetical protein